jgi:hypothetical protein
VLAFDQHKFSLLLHSLHKTVAEISLLGVRRVETAKEPFREIFEFFTLIMGS